MQFKFIHKTVATKGELFKYGIKPDVECCFCRGKDSIDHTFIHCCHRVFRTKSNTLVQ